jgi:hypothetical protein
VLSDVGAALLRCDEEPKIARQVHQEGLRLVAEQRWFHPGMRDLPWWRTVDEDDETLAVRDAPEDAADSSFTVRVLWHLTRPVYPGSDGRVRTRLAARGVDVVTTDPG